MSLFSQTSLSTSLDSVINIIISLLLNFIDKVSLNKI